jgi:hypothetical protein
VIFRLPTSISDTLLIRVVYLRCGGTCANHAVPFSPFPALFPSIAKKRTSQSVRSVLPEVALSTDEGQLTLNPVLEVARESVDNLASPFLRLKARDISIFPAQSTSRGESIRGSYF